MNLSLMQITLLCTVLAAALLSYPLQAYAEHDISNFDGLSVVFIDLEKGDSTLVVFPNGKSMLIDGGLATSYPDMRDVISEFDLSRIDVVVATHPDQDHISGLSELIEDQTIAVGSVFISPVSEDTEAYRSFLSLAQNEQIVYSGTTMPLDDDVYVQVLSPPRQLIPDDTNASSANSNSIVLLLEYGDIEMLFTSDTTHTTESWLVRSQPDLIDVDIMSSPHHGSKHSNTPAFILATSPGVVIFSADEDNQYNYPHEETISRYVSAGITSMHTSNGDIIFQTDGTNCSTFFLDFWQSESACFPGIQMLGVAAAQTDLDSNKIIVPTEKGTLNVAVWIDELASDRTTRMTIDFINPLSGKTQEHIDYTVLVTKDGNEVFGPIPLTHTSLGTVRIPMHFAEDGVYDVLIDVAGILFRPIPLESASIELPVESTGSSTQDDDPDPTPTDPDPTPTDPDPTPTDPDPTPTPDDREPTDNGGCLIATAAFGSELAPQVQLLRELRDEKLLQSESGAAFLSTFNQLYYSFSPTVADLERQNPAFKELVKVVITPMITSLSILDHVPLDSEAEVLTYGIGIILLNVGVYVGIPTAVVISVRQHRSR